jgi:hypothetical protein
MIAVGLLIGWNLPQPAWAQKVQAGVTMWVRDKWTEWRG